MIRFVAHDQLIGFYALLINYQLITTYLLAILLSAANIIWTEVTFDIDYILSVF